MGNYCTNVVILRGPWRVPAVRTQSNGLRYMLHEMGEIEVAAQAAVHLICLGCMHDGDLVAKRIPSVFVYLPSGMFSALLYINLG